MKNETPKKKKTTKLQPPPITTHTPNPIPQSQVFASAGGIRGWGRCCVCIVVFGWWGVCEVCVSARFNSFSVWLCDCVIVCDCFVWLCDCVFVEFVGCVGCLIGVWVFNLCGCGCFVFSFCVIVWLWCQCVIRIVRKGCVKESVDCAWLCDCIFIVYDSVTPWNAFFFPTSKIIKKIIQSHYHTQ